MVQAITPATQETGEEGFQTQDYGRKSEFKAKWAFLCIQVSKKNVKREQEILLGGICLA